MLNLFQHLKIISAIIFLVYLGFKTLKHQGDKDTRLYIKSSELFFSNHKLL